MAIDYSLIVPGAMTEAELAERVGHVPDGAVTVTFTRGKNGYFADDEQGWELEPERYVKATFRATNERSDEAAETVAEVLERVLAGGDEDLVLMQLGEHRLLERRGGEITRFPSALWDTA
jgi:hypothetical protein